LQVTPDAETVELAAGPILGAQAAQVAHLDPISMPEERACLIPHIGMAVGHFLVEYVPDRHQQETGDADDGPQFERVVQLSCGLANEGVPSYLEESRSGGYLWLFFASPLPRKDARLFA